MKAMENYFEYIYIYAVCGIPEVTLLGTSEDWQKILDKTRQLARYNLSWWVDEMVPVLEKIVETSKGKIDRDFWRSMFKIHDTGPIGCSPSSANGKRYFDGWIVKFFPYDNEGNRNDLHQIEDHIELPDEIVKTDLKYQIILPNGAILTIPLELWAGFIGLEQDPATFALTPTIGWMIRKKSRIKKWFSKCSVIQIRARSRFESSISPTNYCPYQLSRLYPLPLSINRDSRRTGSNQD